MTAIGGSRNPYSIPCIGPLPPGYEEFIHQITRAPLIEVDQPIEAPSVTQLRERIDSLESRMREWESSISETIAKQERLLVEKIQFFERQINAQQARLVQLEHRSIGIQQFVRSIDWRCENAFGEVAKKMMDFPLNEQVADLDRRVQSFCSEWKQTLLELATKTQTSQRVTELEKKLQSRSNQDGQTLRREITELEKKLQSRSNEDGQTLRREITELEKKLQSRSSQDCQTLRREIRELESRLQTHSTEAMQRWQSEIEDRFRNICDRLDSLGTQDRQRQSSLASDDPRVVAANVAVSDSPTEEVSAREPVTQKANGSVPQLKKGADKKPARVFSSSKKPPSKKCQANVDRMTDEEFERALEDAASQLPPPPPPLLPSVSEGRSRVSSIESRRSHSSPVAVPFEALAAQVQNNNQQSIAFLREVCRRLGPVLEAY